MLIIKNIFVQSSVNNLTSSNKFLEIKTTCVINTQSPEYSTDQNTIYRMNSETIPIKCEISEKI